MIDIICPVLSRPQNAQPLVASIHKATTVPAVRLFDLLPEHPMVTLSRAMDLLGTTKPTAAKAIDALRKAGVLKETTRRERDRVYAYAAYLEVLTEDTAETGGLGPRVGKVGRGGGQGP